ncbi:endonuclease/exonuclease/phosphatase family protein [Streptomyces sp. NPDC057623]|uniref:endonuclease/exonuclease/phosphatase family protein n=1 Tax=Streptomyces sp. NPDC057623 TaxID=3346187 RepID=UPI0036A5C7B0
MSPTLLKLATWNIGGGILGESHQRGRSPSLEYYASLLKEHAPDVVCLQEAHDYHGHREGQSEYLARCAGYPYVGSFPTSESHMAENASLSLGILSRFPIEDMVYRQFPNPRLEGVSPSGEPWNLHDKGYVVASIDLGDQKLGLINGHCFPLHHFGASPTEPVFARMWDMLTADLLEIGGAGTACAALDANHGRIEEVLKEVLLTGSYLSAFEGTPTTPRGVQKDHILYGHSMRLITTTVAATESDHSYCQVSVLV